MGRYINCYYCAKKIYENTIAIRRRGYIASYCSYRCLVFDNKLCTTVKVNDEILEEDNLSWDGAE